MSATKVSLKAIIQPFFGRNNAQNTNTANDAPQVSERVSGGTMVHLSNNFSIGEKVGTLIYNDDNFFAAHTNVFGLWTIELPNGNRYRDEGYLNLL